MNHLKPRFRAPGTLRYRGKTFIYAGKGAVPCSASYMSQSDGSPLTVYYATLARVGAKAAGFKPHNNRLAHIQVAWTRFDANEQHHAHGVFIVGPVAQGNGSGELAGRGVWACQPLV